MSDHDQIVLSGEPRGNGRAEMSGWFVRYRGLLLGTAITAFWLGMMFTLVRDKIIPQQREAQLSDVAISPADLTKNWRDMEELMVVKLAGADVGFASSSVKKVMDGRVATYVADYLLNANINFVGMMRGITIRARGELDASFDLSRFHIDADLAGVHIGLTGATAGGNSSGDELWVEVRYQERTTRARYQLDRKISLLEAVRPVATRNFQIKPGATIAIPVVDPVMSMEHGTMELTVGKPEQIVVDEEKVTAFPVDMRLNSIRSKSWVDRNGETLKRQLAGGLVLERASTTQHRKHRAQLPRPVEVPLLKGEDFVNLKAQRLGKLSQGDQSPLDTLSSFSILK